MQTTEPFKTGINGGRFLASIAIVILHCFSFDSEFSGFVNQLCRFAVPFFFITSGYFFYSKVSRENQLSRVLKSCFWLGFLTLLWSAIFSIDAPVRTLPFSNPIPRVVENVSTTWSESGLEILLTGLAKHLWYMPSLAIGMLFVYSITRFLQVKYLSLIAAPLFIVGLLIGSYSFALGNHASFYARNGIFFSVPFLITGVLVRKIDRRPPITVLLPLSLFLFVFQVVESKIISIISNVPMAELDFTVVTLPLSLTVFMLFEKLEVPQPLAKAFASLAFGIYLVHPLVYKHVQFLRTQVDSGLGQAALITITVLVISVTGSELYRRLARIARRWAART